MLDIYLFENKKRLNSTKNAPSDELGTHYEVVLKDNTSFIDPVFRLKAESKPSANYLKFDGRYYWIRNIISIANNLYEIICHEDCLTTFKHHIQATSAFVLYDSTPNDQLPDSRLGIETDCEVQTATANMPWGFSTDSSAGTYFIATVGESDILDIDFNVSLSSALTFNFTQNGRAGTGVYAIPGSSIKEIGFDFSDFVLELFNILNNSHTDFTTQKDELEYIVNNPAANPVNDIIKMYNIIGNIIMDATIEYPTRLALLMIQNIIAGGNALRNIKASYWIPFNIPGDATSSAGNKLALGTYTDTVPGLERVVKPVITAVNIPVSIPWNFDDWRNVACTEIMLYIPLIGCVSIPPEVVKGNNSLSLKFSLNLYSGDLACEILCDGAEIATYGANSAMNILIGDSNINMGGIVNTVIAGVTKNYAGVAGGVVDTLSGMNTSVGGIGGGAGTGLTDQIVCIVRTHNTSQEPSALLATIGTPTRQLKTLSGSGYCQCLNAQVNITSTGPFPNSAEIEEINNYLNTGVYLE